MTSFTQNGRRYTFFFYKQPKFWPAEPQIFENQSNLVSNCRASNRKFLATWASNPLFCPIFVYFSLISPKNVSNFIAILSLILGTFDSNSRLNRKMGLLIKKNVYVSLFVSVSLCLCVGAWVGVNESVYVSEDEKWFFFHHLMELPLTTGKILILRVQEMFVWLCWCSCHLNSSNQ